MNFLSRSLHSDKQFSVEEGLALAFVLSIALWFMMAVLFWVVRVVVG